MQEKFKPDFFPHPTNTSRDFAYIPEDPEVKESDVEILVDGQEISARLFVPAFPKGKVPGVLMAHGWRGDKLGSTYHARRLTKQGLACLTFDFRGHGSSQGDISYLTRQDFLNDAIAAYDFLLQVPDVDPDNISIAGSSFGAYIGAILSKERKLKSMVLRVPADYPDKDFNSPRMQTADKPGAMEWRNLVRQSDDTEALRAVHNFSGDVLIVESEKDTAVPHGTIQSYLNAVPDPKRTQYILMKGAPHAIGYNKKFVREFGNILLDWFGKESK